MNPLLKQPYTYTNEISHCSLQYTLRQVPALDKRSVPNMYIQCLDAYGYQRELSICFDWSAENKNQPFLVHSYTHPGLRYRAAVSKKVAHALMAELISLTQEYPTLLWNETSQNRPRCQGFVWFHERLIRGEEPSVTLLR